MSRRATVRDELLKLAAVEAIRQARIRYGLSYKTLAQATGVDETLLARYASGSVTPSPRQAVRIWRGLEHYVGPRRLIADRLEAGRLDLESALGDPFFLLSAQVYFLEKIPGDIDKILVPEASGISLATALSLAFRAGLVVARRVKGYAWADYIEESITDSVGRSRVFHARRDLLPSGSRVLIVDDIVQSGLTLSTMERLVDKAGGSVEAVAAVVTVGDEWRRHVRSRVYSILDLTKQ